MPPKYEEDEIECDIIESYGSFSQGSKFWNKEVNLVSWNGRPPKLDIRNWQTDHEKCGKGITLTREEAAELAKLLNQILSSKPRPGNPAGRAGRPGGRNTGSAKTGANTQSKRMPGRSRAPEQRARKKPPATLEPYYRELGLPFGVGPEECKTARNRLLKKHHPDINAGNAASATSKTIRIKEAYETIAKWWKGI